MEDTELEECYEKYKNAVYQTALAYLKNKADAEDILQETFMKRYHYKLSFPDSEQEKAWLLRVAINLCKNLLKSSHKRNCISLEETEFVFENQEEHTVTEAVMNLEPKYRMTIHLYYVEGYSVQEISKILSISSPAVRTRLHRARQMLKDILGKEFYI